MCLLTSLPALRKVRLTLKCLASASANRTAAGSRAGEGECVKRPVIGPASQQSSATCHHVQNTHAVVGREDARKQERMAAWQRALTSRLGDMQYAAHWF